MLYTGIVSVAVLVAAYSLADQVVWPREQTSAAVAATMAGTGGEPAVPEATTAAGSNGAGTPCWRDWPYVEGGCSASRSRMGSAPAAPQVRTAADTPGLAKDALTTSSIAASAVGHKKATDGSGAPATVGDRTAGSPAAGAQVAVAPAAPPASAVGSRPAAPPQLSERDLTFKRGYAQRLAARGRTVGAPPAAHPAKPPVVHKAARAKPRRSRAMVQVYQLPDGRKVVVHRQYRRNDTAQSVVPAGPRGFRWAENGAQRFGEPYGERRGWFW